MHSRKIYLKNGYVFDASMARPQPKCGQMHRDHVYTVTAKNDEISPHFLLGELWGNGLISRNFPKRKWNFPFPLNFHPRTMGKFWYFLLCVPVRPILHDTVFISYLSGLLEENFRRIMHFMIPA